MTMKSKRSLTRGRRTARRRRRPARTRRGDRRSRRTRPRGRHAARPRPRASRPSWCRPTSDGGGGRPCRSRARRCGRHHVPRPRARPRTILRVLPIRASAPRPSSGPTRRSRRGARRSPSPRDPTTRRLPQSGAIRRGKSSAPLLDEALLLQPGGRDVLAVLLIHRHLLVHVVQLALRELRADRVQQALERAVVLLQDRVADDRRDVVGERQVLVVVEEDEVFRDDARVTREEEPDVDLLPVERGDGQRSARVERLKILKNKTVYVL